MQFVDQALLNNLWVIFAALLVFLMTIAVGFLEVGELGEGLEGSLLKTVMITGVALFVMAFVGFDTAFAPAVAGLIGNPVYNGLFLGGFSPSITGLLNGAWWSMTDQFFGTGLTTGTYFLFETAFAAVTFALVAVVALRKVKLQALMIYSVVYFAIIWSLPAAWIWNPTGWLYLMGMRDFAGGLVVHAAAGAAGLGIVAQIWKEERARGLRETEKVGYNTRPGWLTLSLLLLWVGWFGFNPGSVLAFNSSTTVVVVTTFLAAASALLSTTSVSWYETKQNPGLLCATNGTLMGLIVITPLAGFVSPGSAVILGLASGPIFLFAERWFSRLKWISDPVGLMPGHMVGGTFGILMIAFFTQNSFAAASGTPSLPDGLLFGGGAAALQQLAVEVFGLAVVMVVVFALSYLTSRAIAAGLRGFTVQSSRSGEPDLAPATDR